MTDLVRLADLPLILASKALQAVDAQGFIQAVGPLLREGDLRVERVFISIRTLHPAFRARTYLWRSENPEVRIVTWPHGLENRPGYYESPDFHVHRTGAEFRVPNLSKVSHRRCDLYAELAGQGYVDYLMAPLRFSDGSINTLSIATRRQGGFPQIYIDQFRSLTGTLTIILERYTALEAFNSTLETYLGRSASREVLKGNIRAGHGELVDAAVLFADISGFTGHASRLGPAATVRLLNEYFDCLTGPIEEHGGYVLKFIGDAILAFFPLLPDGSRPAPRAAVDVIGKRLKELNEARREHGDLPIRHGLCVHFGRVLYGNVGATERLDFTIIGDAVNVAARGVEAAKTLAFDTLFTAGFVEQFGDTALAKIGTYELRGIPEGVTLFTYQKGFRKESLDASVGVPSNAVAR